MGESMGGHAVHTGASAICVAVAAIAVAAAYPHVAAADSPAPIAFSDQSPLALSTEKADAQLVNNTTSEWTLSATAYLVTDNGASRISVPVDLPKTIGAADTAALVLAPSSSDTKAASGFVVVTATSGGQTTVARRELQVAPATPAPLVDKWSGSNQSFTISGAASGLPDLPLNGPDCGSLGLGSHDATVSAGSDIAALQYACKPGDQTRSARLDFDDGQVKQVGQYSGTLKLGDKSVALSYLKARSVWLAILTILIGLALAIWRQVWTSAVRPVRRVDERLTLIGRDALDRQADFKNRSVGTSYRVYDVVPAAAAEVARLQTQLAGLTRWRVAFGWGSGDEQDRLDAVVADAAKLDEVIQQWPSLAGDLHALDDELEKVEQPADPNAPAALAPLVVSRAHDLLAPLGGGPTTKELTIDEARRLLEEVPKTTKVLELLPVAAQLEDDAANLPAPTSEPSDRDVWAEVRRLDRQIHVELALAEDAFAVEKEGVDALIDRARTLVRQLPPPVGGRLAAAIAPGAVIPEPAIAFISGVGRIARTAWSAVSSTREIDLLWLLISIAVAIWSGLQLYYIDKPWGRPGDVLILLVWAFGATTVLTGLLSALENVAAGTLPLRKSKAGGNDTAG